jgi:hypothetical protein
LYWQTSGLGTSDAAVRVRFNPVTTPGIDWSQQTGGDVPQRRSSTATLRRPTVPTSAQACFSASTTPLTQR